MKEQRGGCLKANPGQDAGPPLNSKERAAQGEGKAPLPRSLPPGLRLSHPAPHSLVAEDFAVVEDLNLEHLIAVNAAGHRPPEGLGREGQLWPWVEMTGRGEGSGRGPLIRWALASASQGPSSHLESPLVPAPPCSVGTTAQSFVKDGARKVHQSSQGPVVRERA